MIAVERFKKDLNDDIAGLRAEVLNTLQSDVKTALDNLPPSLRDMTLRDFLSLIEVAPQIESTPRKRKILGLDATDVARISTINNTDRRMTRSMTAKMRQESFIIPRDSNIIPPATPRLFPGLPETPAAIRQRIQRNEVAKPVRIAGSTIRATNIVAAEKENEVNVMNLIHMELSDGKVVDVDLTKSPGSVFTGIGKEKATEVKEWLSQYANAFTSFLKRLGG